MTTITIARKNDDTYSYIECRGHAGYAEYGHDIVCSAVSVLTINLINSIDSFTDDKYSTEQDENKGLIVLRFSEKPSHDADLLVKSFQLGVESIFQQYGKKYLNIKFRRE